MMWTEDHPRQKPLLPLQRKDALHASRTERRGRLRRVHYRQAVVYGYYLRTEKMNRIADEKHTVETMIRLYCRKQHKGSSGLCPDCQALLDYAMLRLDHCRFGEAKPTCDSCPVHCYKPDMREQIRQVMRYSGPRMILYNPVMAIKHVVRKLRSKKDAKRK